MMVDKCQLEQLAAELRVTLKKELPKGKYFKYASKWKKSAISNILILVIVYEIFRNLNPWGKGVIVSMAI